MSELLLDSTVLIEGARGLERAKKFVDAQRQADITLSIAIVTSMELIVGCRTRDEAKRMKELLAAFVVHDMTASIAQKALALLEEHSRNHGLRIPDALIAATALEHNVELITSNTKHFKQVHRLKVRAPY